MLEQTVATSNVDDKIVWKVFLFVIANRFSARDVWRRRCRRVVALNGEQLGDFVWKHHYTSACVVCKLRSLHSRQLTSTV